MPLSAAPAHPLAQQHYRCVVVHSTALEARALARQARWLQAERQALKEALAVVPTFQSAEKADAAAAALLVQLRLRYHTLQLGTRPVLVPARRGRGPPPKDAPPPAPVTRFSWTPDLHEPQADRLRREVELRSTFVLVAYDSGRPPRELLAVYKRQQTPVDSPFHRTKALAVVSMFLDRPERVRAMGYVLLMAYVAFSVMQRRVRHGLAERHQQLLTFDNRRTATPTGEVVLDHWAELHTDIVTEHGESIRVLKVAPTSRHLLDPAPAGGPGRGPPPQRRWPGAGGAQSAPPALQRGPAPRPRTGRPVPRAASNARRPWVRVPGRPGRRLPSWRTRHGGRTGP